MEKLLADDSFPVTAYGRLNRFGICIQSLVLLLIRLTWGFQTANSGFGHLQIVDDMVKNFIGWGVPLPRLNVYISSYTELVCGSLLVIGLGTRLISIPLVFNFIVAIATAGRPEIIKEFKTDGIRAGFITLFNDSAFPMLMMSLMMLAFGAGKISVDYLLGRKMFCQHEASPPRI